MDAFEPRFKLLSFIFRDFLKIRRLTNDLLFPFVIITTPSLEYLFQLLVCNVILTNFLLAETLRSDETFWWTLLSLLTEALCPIWCPPQ